MLEPILKPVLKPVFSYVHRHRIRISAEILILIGATIAVKYYHIKVPSWMQFETLAEASERFDAPAKIPYDGVTSRGYRVQGIISYTHSRN